MSRQLEETLEGLGDRIVEISNSNRSALDIIKSRLGEEVISGYNYKFEISATKAGGDWALSATPYTSLASHIIDVWEFKGDNLEVAYDVFNDNIDYSIKDLNDVIRLNDILRKVGTNYAELFADRPRTRAAVTSFISNLNIITHATEAIFNLTRDIENKKESESLKDAIAVLRVAFEKVNAELPGSVLQINTNEFVGFGDALESSEALAALNVADPGAPPKRTAQRGGYSQEKSLSLRTRKYNETESLSPSKESLAPDAIIELQSKGVTIDTPAKLSPTSDLIIDTPAKLPTASDLIIDTPAKLPPTSDLIIDTPAKLPPTSDVIIDTPAKLPPTSDVIIDTQAKEPPASDLTIDTPAKQPPASDTTRHALPRKVELRGPTAQKESSPAKKPLVSSERKNFVPREISVPPVPPVPHVHPVTQEGSEGAYISSEKIDMNAVVTFNHPEELSMKVRMDGFNHTSSVRDIVYLQCKGRPHLASCSYDRTVKIWKLPGYKAVKTLKGHKGNVNALVTYELNSKSFLASGSTDMLIKVWNLDDNKAKTLRGHTSAVRSLVVFYQRGLPALASGSSDKTIRIWDLTTYTLTRTLNGHMSFVYALSAYTVNNRNHLISGSNDNTIKVWNLAKKTVVTLKGHKSYIWKLAVFTNNKTEYLASGGADSTVRVWHLQKKKLVYTLSGHAGCINALALFYTGNIPCLASADSAGVIRLWNLKTTEQFASFNPFMTTVTALRSYCHNGKPGLAVGHYQNIELWAE